MDKLFVPYGLTVKLVEKGFNEPCLALYNREKVLRAINLNNPNDKTKSIKLTKNISKYPAPTYQQALDWLREKHRIFIEINPMNSWETWVFRVYLKGSMSPFYSNPWNGETYDSYHKAMVESLNEALNLI